MKRSAQTLKTNKTLSKRNLSLRRVAFKKKDKEIVFSRCVFVPKCSHVLLLV